MVTIATAYLVCRIGHRGYCPTCEGHRREKGYAYGCPGRGYTHSSQCSAQHDLTDDRAYSRPANSANSSGAYDLGRFASYLSRICGPG